MSDQSQEVATVRPVAPSTSIVEMEDRDFERMKGVATMFAQAGIFKDARQAPVAFAKMVVGRELGLGIPQSMMGIHLLPGGGIQMHYSTILQLVRENGYDYRIIEQTNEKCMIKWFRGNAEDGVEVGVSIYTWEMAEKAGLTTRGKDNVGKSMYDKVPENMLLARAVSNGTKAHVPAVFRGIPVYVPGEVPAAELTEGEGTGEARGIELPVGVEAVIERAEKLGHAGWAERATWEYRADRGPEVLAASVAEASADLDAVEARGTGIPDAEIEPDVPVDDTGLPETDDQWRNVAQPGESDWSAEATEEATEEPTGVVIVEDDSSLSQQKFEPKRAPEIDVQVLRTRLAELQGKRGQAERDRNEDLLRMIDEEMDSIEEQLLTASGEAPGPEQLGL